MKELNSKEQSSNDKFWVHEAELQRATSSRNASGQEVKNWETIQSGIQCYVRGLSGTEIVAAERVGHKINGRMYCDKSVEAIKTDRIVSGGKTYEIEYVNGQIGSHLQIDLRSLE